MKKDIFKRMTAGMLGCLLSFSAIQPAVFAEERAQAAGNEKGSSAIVTEIENTGAPQPEDKVTGSETEDQIPNEAQPEHLPDEAKEAEADPNKTAAAEEPAAAPAENQEKTGDPSKAPALVITELTPDTSNVNGADAYEFIEIYNNADRAVDLSDYKLVYNYPDNGPDSDTVWWETSERRMLEAGETLVFWVKNGGNDHLTPADFNQKYGTELDASQLIEISCGGMSNSGVRALKLMTQVKDVVDRVEYNTGGADNTFSKTAIQYQNRWSEESGQYVSVLVSDQETPTPGRLDEGSRPVQGAVLTVPSREPVLDDQTPESFDNATEALNFTLSAVADQTTVKTVTLYLKANQQGDFEGYHLARTEGDLFTKTLSNIDLLNKKAFTYYFEVSDGFNRVRTPEKTIANTSAGQVTPFNLTDGQVVSRQTQIVTGGERLIIDGQDVTAQTIAAPNGTGKFVFDASQTDVFFKNAVAIGDEVLGVFNDGTYNEWRTYIYDVNAKSYNPETRSLTVEIHAGNKANPLEHNIENNDDFVVKNIRMVMPDGTTLYPSKYEGKKGLGAVEHENMDHVQKNDVTVKNQEAEISMGDGTSKIEILYVTFELPQQSFDGIRYDWDTTAVEDGAHRIDNGKDQVQVIVDNTAPEIQASVEEGKIYHQGTITVTAKEANGEAQISALLDDQTVELPYAFTSKTLKAGTRVLKITASDQVGNTREETIHFEIPEEDAVIKSLLPEEGKTIKGDPELKVLAEDPTEDKMTVTFKKGERIDLKSEKIHSEKGVSRIVGIASPDFPEGSPNGFPYEQFDLQPTGDLSTRESVDLTWTGESSSTKTFMYVKNLQTGRYDKLSAIQGEDQGKMTLKASVPLEGYLDNAVLHLMVQNGEGATPVQYEAGESVKNPSDTPREQYDFTFAVESDTQYYNEDYEGNPDQSNNGQYQYQLDIHNWILENRERMNIQYLFHNGDIIDDEPNVKEWEQADAAYRLLDEAGFAYGILAGNHDVGHLSGDYTHYGTYFGEARYAANPWYGGSYQNNRGHYDLISVGGIDFIMIYTGWGIGDDEIQWMNDVLAAYPERTAILNFHEYLLASGGLGEEPQRVYDEVVSKNENVSMVLSGHYHNACTRTDTFTNADGSTRKVTSLLFDYQGLPEGGMGYMRLMHFDTKGQTMTVRTYSPSLDDYDAKISQNPGPGNDKVFAEAGSINGEEAFTISFEDLGIDVQAKTLKTDDFTADVRSGDDAVIGRVEGVESGTEAAFLWKDAPEGEIGWYAEVTDENGGLTRSEVRHLTVVKKPGESGGSQDITGGQSGSQNLGSVSGNDTAQGTTSSLAGGLNAATGILQSNALELGALAALAAVLLMGGLRLIRKKQRSDR